MLNKTIQIGRLTAAPEIRYTQTGTQISSFTIAVEEDYAGQDGKRPVDFFDVVAWGKTAEIAAKYLSKGAMIAVSGKLKSNTYKDKNGNTRKKIEIKAEGVYFLEKKKADAPQQTETDQWPENENDYYDSLSMFQNDMPF